MADLDPSAIFTLWWNERAKRWDLVVSGRRGEHSPRFTRTVPIMSSVPMDGVGLAMVAHAIRRELEGWLPFQAPPEDS